MPEIHKRFIIPQAQIEVRQDVLFKGKKHPIVVEQPFPWLESDDRTLKIQEWEEIQTRHAQQYLNEGTLFQEVEAGIKSWYELGSVGAPIQSGENTFQWKRDQTQRVEVLYLLQEDHAIELLNINEPESKAKIHWSFFSPNGKYLAYGISKDGSETTELQILDVDIAIEKHLARQAGKQFKKNPILEDTIKFTRDCYLSWTADSEAFFYTRLPDPAIEKNEDKRLIKRVYYHQLNTNWEADPEILNPKYPGTGQPESPITTDFPHIQVSKDGTLAFWITQHQWHAHTIFVSAFDGNWSNLDWKLLVDSDRYEFIVTEHNGYLYVRTNYGADKFQVLRVAYDATNLSTIPDISTWEVFIPEDPTSPLDDFKIIGADRALLKHHVAASSRLKLVKLNNTKQEAQIAVPSGHIVTEINGSPDSNVFHYASQSFVSPGSVFQVATENIQQTVLPGLTLDADQQEVLKQMEVEVITSKSPDGETITMLVAGNKEKSNGSAVIYFYPGFNHLNASLFSPGVAEWVKSGGKYVLVLARGSGDFGSTWHEAGVRENIMNAVNDIIVSIEHLIELRYVDKDKIALLGQSYGALIAGIIANERPDLVKAVLLQMGILNPLNGLEGKLGQSWIGEIGNYKIYKECLRLLGISPLHNLPKIPPRQMPAIFVQVGEMDDRVTAGQSRQYTATTQRLSESGLPVYYSLLKGTGHLNTMDPEQATKYRTEWYTFLRRVFNIPL